MAQVVYVELLCDVAEGGRDLVKAQAAADAFGLGKSDPKYPRLKVTTSKRGRIEYVKGLVVTMTEPDAAKWVERGIGQIVDAAAPDAREAVIEFTKDLAEHKAGDVLTTSVDNALNFIRRGVAKLKAA